LQTKIDKQTKRVVLNNACPGYINKTKHVCVILY